MRPGRLILFSLLLGMALLVACSPQPADEAPGSAAAPTVELAYDFTLTTLEGESITLSDLRGGWALVNFWATWCPPCVQEMPYLQEVARSREIHVLGVNVGEKEPAVRAFVEKYGIEFPILMGMDQVLQMAYNARGLPQSYLIAPDGSIALRVVGGVTSERLEPWFDDHGVPVRAQ
jgi:thiol-disulfide isomerase/thioredoxin